MLDDWRGGPSERHHGAIRTRPAVTAALIIGIGVTVVADLPDGVVDDGIAAELGRAAVRAATVTGDLIAVVAFLSWIDDTVAAEPQHADTLTRGQGHAGWARHDTRLDGRARACACQDCGHHGHWDYELE
jgi:hypothetical protein